VDVGGETDTTFSHSLQGNISGSGVHGGGGNDEAKNPDCQRNSYVPESLSSFIRMP
jgi:hypothetical protein